MTRTSPPLNSLRAFEAAGRHGGFVQAGIELGVTPAAVSQLVRKLESHLGKKLFQRFNNRIILTDAGRALFAATTPAMTELSEAITRVSRNASLRKLRLSVVPSLGECWALQILGDFLATHPRVRLAISIEDSAAQGSFDLRLNYGRLPDDDLSQDEFWRDEVLPMCAPALLQAHHGEILFNTSVSNQLIHTQWGSSFASNATWRDWFRVYAPGTYVDVGRGHDVNASRLALQLAEQGGGIALGQGLLARESLRRGSLVAASRHGLPLGQSYVIAVPIARERHPDVQAFKTWVRSHLPKMGE